ncbi:ABC transporter substrate-binding protein [Rhizobium sp. ZPR3]|uniref:ABC transporter substrate-binding protein n=2 Tax=unclassified Rhizobium TaxID=2613769 RepID=A0AAU7SQW9_9HYPH
MGVQDNPPQLDPLRLTTNVTFRVASNIYDSLIRIDHARNGELSPGLADSWQQIDTCTWDFTIRDGVRFHDGSVLTSEDVAFTFGPGRMLTEGLPGQSVSRQFFGGLARVEAVGPLKVRFVTKAVDPLFQFRLAGWGSQIVSKSAFERIGDWDKWAMAPIGTGPYRVEQAKTGEMIKLVSHDAYWGGRPPFSSITFKVMPEAASRVNALAAGDVHIITEVTPDQVTDIQGRSRLEVVGGAINNIRVLNYGTLGGPLADRTIRMALNLAIDRSLIAQQLFGGKVTVPRGFQWPEYGDLYIKDYPTPAYDPDAARQALKRAGYSGQPIEYRTQANYYTAELDTAQALQQMWQSVGVNVQLKVCENFTQVFAQPNNAIFNGSINMVYPDLMGSIYPLYGPNGFIHYQAKSWDNPEFDRIGETLATTLDVNERRQLHRRALDIFGEIDPPGTVLHETAMLYGKQANVPWSPQRTPMMDFGPFSVRS